MCGCFCFLQMFAFVKRNRSAHARLGSKKNGIEHAKRIALPPKRSDIHIYSSGRIYIFGSLKFQTLYWVMEEHLTSPLPRNEPGFVTS